jgi:hypothetical protein
MHALQETQAAYSYAACEMPSLLHLQASKALIEP